MATLHAETLSVPATIATGLEKGVTAELNEFLKSAPDGSTIAFPEKAIYRIEGTLHLKDRKGITIDGKGTTIRATDPLPDYGKRTTTPAGRPSAPAPSGSSKIARRWLLLGICF